MFVKGLFLLAGMMLLMNTVYIFLTGDDREHASDRTLLLSFILGLIVTIGLGCF